MNKRIFITICAFCTVQIIVVLTGLVLLFDFTITVPVILFSSAILMLSVCAALILSKNITEKLLGGEKKSTRASKPYPEIMPYINKIDELNDVVKLQRDEVWQKREEFRAVTDNMHEGIMIFDSSLNPLIYNPAALKLVQNDIGFKENSFNGSEILREALNKAIRGGKTEDSIKLGGKQFQLSANPVFQNDKVVGVAVILLDKTEMLERDQFRREFTANVSHELKTPLTSISGFAELMMNGMVLADDVADFSTNIYHETQRLITLVNDIIKLSDIEDDTRLHEIEQVDLFVVAGEVVERLSGAAARHNISVELKGKSAEIAGVEQMIFEMLRNLCDNAIKYNHSDGKVVIDVSDCGEYASVSVGDNGIGIPPEHQARIFERFYRVDKSHSKEIGGTGLGLSIVKHGAEYHNAEIILDSHVGEGTVITINFPKNPF